jgi:MFS family permease
LSKGAKGEFAAYFVGRQSYWFAAAVDDTAIAWQVYAIRHQPFDLALVGLILFLPQLLLSIPAGLLADHLDRRLVCVTAAVANVIGSLLFVLLAREPHASLALYYAAVGFIGIVYALGVPAQRALLPSIVPAERYMRASALVSSVSQLNGIVAPALAGLLIALSTPLAFEVAAIVHLIGGCAFFFLRPRAPEAPSEDARDLWGSAVDGLRFIAKQRIILGAISLDLFAVLFGGATALLPIYATQILHVGATGFGWLRAAPALGAGIVALWMARRPIQRHSGRWLLWCITGFGAATIVFGLSKSMPLSLVALAFTGGFDMVSMVIRSALTQLGTPNALRGRVGAIENIFIGASNELGTFESGAAAAWLGAVPAVVLGGIATLAVIALWSRLFPELGAYDELVTAAAE